MEEVTLKEYFESRLSGIEKQTESARLTMEKRLDSMNEFRKSNEDQSRRSPTREEMTAELAAIKKDIRELTTFKDSLSGKASQTDVTRNTIVAYTGLGITIIMAILKIFGK